MKKILFGAAAAAAMLALPTAAHAQGGYVDVFGGTDKISLGGPSADSDVWGVDGVLSFENGQVGAHYADFSDGSGDGIWSVDGHLFMRNDAWQLGAGASYNDLNGDSEWTIAGEGLLFLDRTTLGASITYSDANLDLLTDDVTSWGINGEARFFLTDNFRLGIGAGWGNLDAGSGSNDDFTSVGANAEWQFDGTPFSVFAAYNHTDSGDFDSDAWGVGARWNFGSQSLIDRDRHGANLSRPTGGISQLFNF